MKRIGITGTIASGKTTVSMPAADKIGEDTVIEHFPKHEMS